MNKTTKKLRKLILNQWNKFVYTCHFTYKYVEKIIVIGTYLIEGNFCIDQYLHGLMFADFVK